MTETKLFPSEICSGYFGIKRFDRKKRQKGSYGISKRVTRNKPQAS